MNHQTSGILFSYANKSQYHDSCIPKNASQPGPQDPTAVGQLNKVGDASKWDLVAQDVIRKQTVQRERQCLKKWEENWGFLADYDPKGNLKKKEKLPERSNMFSTLIPNTNAGNHGYRLATETGQTMQNLEFKFFSYSKRRKLPSDMLCY